LHVVKALHEVFVPRLSGKDRQPHTEILFSIFSEVTKQDLHNSFLNDPITKALEKVENSTKMLQLYQALNLSRLSSIHDPLKSNSYSLVTDLAKTVNEANLSE